MAEEKDGKSSINVWWYVLPVVAAMIAGYAIKKGVSLKAVVPFLLFVAALAVAFYLWAGNTDDKTG